MNLSALASRAFYSDLYRALQNAKHDAVAQRQRDRSIARAKIAASQTVSSGKEVKLEIGAGAKKGQNGWTTLDQNNLCDIQWDLNNPLPFPDNSVDAIYSSHVLEHFPLPTMKELIGECVRVLKPGGEFIVAVPDASRFIHAYSTGQQLDEDLFFPYKPAFRYHSMIDYVNYTAYMSGQHHHMFDQENLLAILQACSFSSVSTRDFDPQLDSQSRDYESIYARAVK
tara:strand:+ start:7234 stop:7911 length:678 start_codon:yes stop_codon:yes gene_type:complete